MRVTRSARGSSGLVSGVVLWAALAALGASPRQALGQTPHVAVVHVDPIAYAPESFVARQEAARQFYATHRDAYDFLVVFPTFPMDRSGSIPSGETEGRHFLVRNAVSGIGLPISDRGQWFGSRERLQGYIDDYALVPGDGQDLEAALAVVGHEIAHQWSGAARFLDRQTGQASDALLGLDHAHWSYFLDSDASVLYGADWLASGGGIYTATAAFRRYSALDLYLMGFLAPDELGPITLLQPSSSVTTPAASPPAEVGTRVAASPLVVSATDLVAAMGARVPASSNAQASFRAAFLVAAAPGQDPTPEQLDFVDAVRREWANRFFFMTRGRAVMQTELVEPPPAALATSPSLDLGIGFLLAQQQADGAWADDPGTGIRDTQSAIEALVGFSSRPGVAPAVTSGAGFLTGLHPVDVDQSARRAMALWSAGVPFEAGPEAPFDLGRANADGGLGLSPGYGSTVIDTVLATFASSGDASAAVAYLESVQGLDGGWGLLADGPSDIATTALVLRLLSRPDLALAQEDAAGRAAAYLLRHRELGGAFVDEADREDRTADALLALAARGSLTGSLVGDAVELLLSEQRADGSWEGSVERTAIALRALRQLMSPNLTIRSSEIALSATSVNEGEPVTAVVLVRNVGYADAQDVSVQAFDAAGQPFGPAAVIPLVGAGDSAVATLVLDTAGHADVSQAYVVVDPSGTIDESTDEDNRAVIDLRVTPRPVLPDLYVAAGSVSTSPSSITRVGTPVTVSALVGNAGLTDVAEVSLVVLSGTSVVATRSIALAGASSEVVTLEGTLPAPIASDRVTVVVDPAQAILEARETNNSASMALTLLPSVDLAVQLASVTPNPVDPGGDAVIQFEVANRGTTACTAAQSRAEILDGAGTVLATVAGPTLGMPSGGIATGTVTWRASAAPAAAVRVTVAQDGDLDPLDNVATGPLTVSESGRPNLAFRGAPVVDPVPPLEGRPAEVRVTVENAGGVAAGASLVELWIGDPAAGGQRGPRVSVPALEAGATAPLALPLAAAPGKPTALVVRVDPDATVAEYDETDNDAVVYVEPLTRPDLAIGEGGVQPTSLFPRRGDQVGVRIVVENLGGQPSAPATVELFAGAPEAGGVHIGSAGVPGIPGRSTTEAVLDWDTSDWSETVVLVAIVNRDGASEDADPGNDRSSRSVRVQGGDLAVSNPYFSPNGDGIKDATEIFYRLDAPGAVDGVVRDERGRTVRVLHGTTAADGSGSLPWDGRTDAGTIAYDGTYRVTVLGQVQPAPLGEVALVLDTDRSSVLDAPRELRSSVVLDEFFRAQSPANEPNLMLTLVGTPDERSGIFHYSHTRASGVEECAYYRVPLDGDLPEPLTPPAFACVDSWRTALSPDGTAIYRGEWGANGSIITRYDLASRTSSTIAELGGWFGTSRPGPDETTWIIEVDGGTVIVDLESGTTRTGPQWDHFPAWAPGGDVQAFVAWAPHGYELHVANGDGTGERAVVVPYPHPICLEHDGEASVARAATYGEGGCLRWEALPIATPEGAYILPDGESFYTFTWVSPTEIAFATEGVNGVRLLDVAAGTVEPVVATEALPMSLVSLLADPAGRNLAIIGWDYAWEPQVWETNLASGATRFTADWTYTSDVEYSFTRFGSALIGQGTSWVNLPNWISYPISHAVALDSLGNLGLRIGGLRKAGSAEIVLRGTAADLNLDRWEITAVQRRGGGLPVPVASGTAVVVDGELARWTPPAPGTWDLTLTGTDLAGNTRSVSSVASWAEVPPIANVRAEPRYFSPNGDGRQETVTVSYSVQEPVSSALDVRSASGGLIRQLPITHANTGSYSLPWDGTDTGGAVQPDGTYTISTTGSRAEVILDRTRPDAALQVRELGPHYVAFVGINPHPEDFCTLPIPTPEQNKAGPHVVIPVLAANVDLRVSDDHLRRWELQTAETAAFGDPVTIMGGGESVDHLVTATFPVSGLPGNWLRLDSFDEAANQTTTLAAELPEQLFVLAYGAAMYGDSSCSGALMPMARPTVTVPTDVPTVPSQLPGIALAAGKLSPRLDFMKPSMAENGTHQAFCYEPAYHAFAIASTIRAPLVGASVSYWDGQQFVTDQSNVSLSPHGAILWDARSLGVITSLELRVTDAHGRVFAAPVDVDYFCRSADVSTGHVACSNAVGLDTMRVTVTSEIPQGVSLRDQDTGADLSSPDLTVTTLVDDHGVPYSYEYTADIALDELPGCRYELISYVPGVPDEEPRVYGHFDLCGLAQKHVEVAGDTATVSLRPRYRKPVSRMDLYLQPLGGKRVLVASVPGAADLSAPIALDLSPFPVDVGLVLTARVVFTDGTAREEEQIPTIGACVGQPIVRPGTKVQIQVSKQPSPVCTARPANWIVRATANSKVDTVVDLGLELAMPGAPPIGLTTPPVVPAASVSTAANVSSEAILPGYWTATARATEASGRVITSAPAHFSTDATPPWALEITVPGANTNACPVARSGTRRVLRVEGAVEGVQLQKPRLFLACGEGPPNPVAYQSAQGVLGEIDVSGWASRDCELMVEVEDDAGSSYCSAPIPFHLVGNGSIEFSAVPALFSPNADGRLDLADLWLHTIEPSAVTVTGTDSASRSGTALLTETNTGAQGFTWDGTLDGLPAADGDVSLRAVAVDPCGNSAEARAMVRVDTIPPRIEVESPRPGDRVRGMITVSGKVSDENFLEYDVAIGPGSSPGAFSTIGTFDRPANGRIGEFSTAGFAPGIYAIRVQARDRAGNHSPPATVEIEVTSEQLIRSLAVEPALVSPNHDGLLDASLARYETLAQATVSLDLITGSSAVLPVLPPVSSPAAAGEVDLLESVLAGLSDGVVTIRLTATAGTLVETKDALLTLDRVPPSLSVDEPANGAVVAHATAVRGQVDDDHLDEWTLTLVQGGVSTTLATGHAPEAGVLATFPDLSEGEFTLILDARDGAGNRWTENATFSVDRTPPTVVLDAPVPDSWVTGRNGPVDVSGHVQDAHLSSVRLEALVEGSEPRELFGGSSLPPSGHVTSWDVLSEADGPLQLRLEATDAAGNTGEALVSLQVDNTVPVVALTAPRDTFVHPGEPVTGVAMDDHLSSWTLELTSGIPSSASIWAPLAEGSSNVEDGILTVLASLPPDGTYGLRLTVTDLAGNVREDVSSFEVDTTPPGPPPSLVVALQGADASVSWEPSPDADVVGYQVLRAGPTGSFTPVGGVVTGTATTDPQIADGQYRYVVLAIDAAGLRSERSPEAALDVDRTPPRVVITAPPEGATVSGTFAVLGTAYSSEDFKELRLFAGAGASPTDVRLVRRSGVPVVAAELGTIDAGGYGDGAQLTIRLEGEDLSGNVAEATATVTVDETAPSAPVLIAAAPSGRTVHVEWQASPEPDVLGYVVFRNGSVASAPGGAVSIRAHLLPPETTTYEDGPLPDGVYTYEVQAYDRALNPSDLSNSLTAEIETQAPRAAIVSPEPLARLEGTAAVLAEVNDQDVASVQFQVRAGSATEFEPLGSPVTRVPFTVPLDLAADSAPILELRAVATDTRGNTDAAPPTVFVFHAPNPAAPDVTATVTGADVQVSWSDPSPAGIAGYEVQRDGASLLPPASRPAGTATASASASTALRAYDGSASTAWTAPSAGHPWWQVDLNAPTLVSALHVQLYATAEVEIAVRVQDVWVPLRTASASSVHVPLGDGLQVGGVRVSFMGGPSTVGLYEVTLDAVPLIPGPTWQDAAVALGAHSYSVHAVSTFGLRAEASASARVYAPSLDPVEAVVSVPALHVTGSDATPSATVTVFRNDVAVGTSIASPDGRFAADIELADGTNTLIASALDPAGNLSLPSEPLSVTYDAAPVAALTLRLTAVHDSTVELAFDVEGDASRIAGFRVRRASAGTTSTLAALGPAARQVTDSGVPNGTYTYSVIAHNEHGFEGAPSNPVEATVTVAPPAAVSVLTVSQVQGYPALRLRWEPASAGGRYQIERALSQLGPFSAVNADRLATAATYVDVGLTPGVTYFYRVREVDPAGNPGPASSVAWGVPLAGPLARPWLFAPTTPEQGWIDLWSSSTDVSGLADPGVWVEVRSNGVWVGAARAGGRELHSEAMGSVWNSRGFGASPDGDTIARGWMGWGLERLEVADVWIEDPGIHSFGRVVFSSDGHWFAFEATATDDGRTHVWLASTHDGAFHRVSTVPGEERAPAWAPDGTKLAYEVRRDGAPNAAISVLEVASSTEQALGASTGVALRSPGWTTSGEPLALASSDGVAGARIVRFDGDSWLDVYATGADMLELVVSPDGTHAALLGDGPGSPMILVELASGTESSTDETPAMERRAAFTSDSSALLVVRDGQLFRTSLVTGETELLGATGPVDVLAGTARGPVALLTTGDVVRYRWGGVFHAPAVPLFRGENTLLATAVDGEGARSQPSEPIFVWVEQRELADLAVTGMAVLPSVPATGDTVQAVVTIRNVGSVDAEQSSLVVKHVEPDGTELELPPAAIGALPAGGTTSAIVTLGAVTSVGEHEVIALIDAAGAVPDPDRQNNLGRRSFTVLASRDLHLSVAAEPSSVGVHGQFTARVTVQNPGAPVNATIVTRLADPDGAAVFEAPPIVRQPLPGGATTTLEAVLSAGTAIAGDYQVVAILTPADGAPVVASTPVIIEPEQSVTLALSADRFSYTPTSQVNLDALVTNASRNATLSGATYHLEILDAAGAVVRTGEATPIPDIWMDGATVMPADVHAATLGSGDFVAHGWVERQGTILAEASTSFTVLATPALVGMVTVAGQGDPPVVPAGAEAAVTVTFWNAGTSVSPATTGRLVLMAPGNAAILSTEEVAVPALGPGASDVQTVALPTSELVLGTYGLILVADVQGAPSTLATARFRTAEATPPTLALQSPAQGAVVPGVVYPWITAQDGDTGVALVRAGVGAASTPLALTNGNAFDGTWSAAVALGADGPYTLVFSSADGEGNDGLTNPIAANPITLTVVSDRTPPVLHVSGVDDGAVVNTPVVLDVTATDLHLASISAEIDGLTYTPGTTYTENGTHVFQAVAVDLAGNTTPDVRVFDLDTIPPDVEIAGVTDGQYLDSAVAPLVVVTDRNPTTHDVTLDGSPWSGAPITGEGHHVLTVDARDIAGNTRHVETEFWIDLTPPTLAIGGVEEGACYSHPVAPVVDADDTNLGAVTARLDGQPFTSGSSIDQDGGYTLAAVVLDLAGHRASDEVSFTIDTAPPVITLPDLDGRFFAAPVTVTYAVTDGTATEVTATLDGAPFDSGIVVSSEGQHVAAVQARDCAGNPSAEAATFTIDSTPPRLTLSGVEDGATVEGPVVVVASVIDETPTTVELLLDGDPYVSGTPISGEGAHVVAAVATDAAGNVDEDSLSFLILEGPPQDDPPRLSVFSDQPDNGFSVGTWGAALEVTTAQAHQGTRSIALSTLHTIGLSAWRLNMTGGFAGLELWIHGGPVGGQEVVLSVESEDQYIAYATAEELLGGPIPAGSWTRVYLPFAIPTKGDVNIRIKGKETDGDEVFLDDIALIPLVHGRCTQAPGASCSDGDACNGDEVCHESGHCLAGIVPTLEDGNPCTLDGCDPLDGPVHVPAPQGSSCTTGAVCENPGTCSAAGQCEPASWAQELRVYDEGYQACFHDVSATGIHYESMAGSSHTGARAIAAESEALCFSASALGGSFGWIQLWVNSAADPGAHATLAVEDSTGGLVWNDVGLVGGGAWQRVDATFARSSTPGRLKVCLLLHGSTRPLYVDDVKLGPVP